MFNVKQKIIQDDREKPYENDEYNFYGLDNIITKQDGYIVSESVNGTQFLEKTFDLGESVTFDSSLIYYFNYNVIPFKTSSCSYKVFLRGFITDNGSKKEITQMLSETSASFGGENTGIISFEKEFEKNDIVIPYYHSYIDETEVDKETGLKEGKKINIPQEGKWDLVFSSENNYAENTVIEKEIIFQPNTNNYNQIVFQLDRNSIDYIAKVTKEGFSEWIPNKKDEYKEDVYSGRLLNISLNKLSTIKNQLETSELKDIVKLGVQGLPNTLFCINGESIHIGKSGIYEPLTDIDYSFFGAILKQRMVNYGDSDKWDYYSKSSFYNNNSENYDKSTEQYSYMLPEYLILDYQTGKGD